MQHYIIHVIIPRAPSENQLSAPNFTAISKQNHEISPLMREKLALKMSSSSTRQSQFFINGEGIDREVITTDICRYLGNDALVQPGTHMVSRFRACYYEGTFITDTG